MTRSVGAGTFLKVRPATSNLEPCQGQLKPPGQEAPISAAPGVGRKVGMQPGCVQAPTSTAISDLTERFTLAAYGRLIRTARGSVGQQIAVAGQ